MVLVAVKKRKAAKSMKAMACNCGCDPCECRGYSIVEAWMLILLGLLGLMETTGFLSFGQIPFGYIWTILVLVIGIKKAMRSGYYKK